MTIIDCHGHYTTAPDQVKQYRKDQLLDLQAGRTSTKRVLAVTDEEIRVSIENAQLKMQRDRETDLTLFSPRALGMEHHFGDLAANVDWAQQCNDLVYRVTEIFPDNFVGVGQLPQVAGEAPGKAVLQEIDRCVNELGFVGINLNPDPSGGHWSDPPLWEKDWWYPVYEKMVEHDLPAMIHVSGSCNEHFHGTGAHYINGDTTAFVQFMTSNIFKDFPTLKFVIPHGGGAVPYHWGRYKGLAQDMGLPPLPELLLDNVFFDTCVYHQPGIDLLLKVVPVKNILFASEMVGAVRGIDPDSGHHYDDTKRYIEKVDFLSNGQKKQIFCENVFDVYPRLHKAKAACISNLK
ncbi:amidohydrolase family protein [Paraburkholderia tropica]|uniref:amidohydrolase family protein n=1 Tax=Paraburkholderia tropica TaxID=92647 RepID=UPI002AB5FDA0|nr:amidohydrolase family protein [Paraburkholderia tropica]